jgi:hypothetical protein
LPKNHGRHDEQHQGAAKQKQAEAGNSHGGVLPFMERKIEPSYCNPKDG